MKKNPNQERRGIPLRDELIDGRPADEDAFRGTAERDEDSEPEAAFRETRGLDAQGAADADELPMDEEDVMRAEIRRTARQQMEDFKIKFIRPLVAFRSLPCDCLLFANHFGHLIGCELQRDIVKRHGGTASVKANVNKYVKKFQRAAGLPAVDGQRETAACLAMKISREDQLKPSSKK